MAENDRMRLLKSDNEKAFKEIVRYCFNDIAGWAERIFPLRFGDRAWGSFTGDTLESALITRNYESRIFGTWQKMSGISFVQSLPEYRNKDNVSLLMKKALVEDHSAGAVFSTLYPFKFGYYEKFGYGYAGGPVSYLFQPDDLAPPKDLSGEIVPYTGDKHELDDIASVSEAWAASYSMGVRPRRLPDDIAREEIEWSKDRIVLCYRDGACRGYLRVHKVIVSQFVSQLEIRKIAWTDSIAFLSLMSFVKKHRDQIKEVKFLSPQNLPLHLVMKEPRVQATVSSDFMARPLDISRVLALKVTRNAAARRVVFSIEDPDLPHNTGTYEIEGDQVRKKACTGENPIRLPVFSSLVFGGYSLREAKLAGRIDPDFPDALSNFFARDPDIFISEHF
jgi:predicted acetyltransferase